MAGKTILIVEDNERNRKLVKVILKAKGYVILEAEDASSAFRELEKTIPDLILMDIGLPQMSGLELTKQIKLREEIKGVPIVALTAHAMIGDREGILAAGCDDYISKPIDINEFPKTIAEILEKSKKLR